MPSSSTKFYIGNTQASAIYAGSTKIWPAASGWTPAQLTGLKVWYEADQIAQANGTAVNSWPNGGSGTAATTTSNLTAPTLQTNVLNGKPVVHFNASAANALRGTYTPSTSICEYGCAVVARIWQLDGAYRVFGSIYPTYRNWLCGWWNATEGTFYGEGFFRQGAAASATLNWKRYTFSQANSTGIYFYDGDTLLQSNPTAGLHSPNGGIALGGYDPNGTQELSHADIAAVFVWESSTAEAERVQLDQYLKTKYGV